MLGHLVAGWIYHGAMLGHLGAMLANLLVILTPFWKSADFQIFEFSIQTCNYLGAMLSHLGAMLGHLGAILVTSWKQEKNFKFFQGLLARRSRNSAPAENLLKENPSLSLLGA